MLTDLFMRFRPFSSEAVTWTNPSDFLFPVHMYEALRKQSLLNTSEHCKSTKGSSEKVE